MVTHIASDAPLALWLSDRATTQGDTVFVAGDEARLDRISRACAGFCAGRVELLVLPPWDVLPYDRVAPSAATVGRRIATLSRLAEPGDRPRLLLTSADAVAQRVPPARAWAGSAITLSVGDTVDVDRLRVELGERGYHLGEAVGDPGEVAFRGHVIDVFPAGDHDPVRLTLEDTAIAAIHWFDPATQRSHGTLDRVVLQPAVEFPLDPAEAEHALQSDEQILALPSGRLVPAFDYFSEFARVLDDGVEARWIALRDQAVDAYETSKKLRRVVADIGTLPKPERLFLSTAALEAFAAKRIAAEPGGVAEPPPRRVRDLIQRAADAKTPVVIATPGDAAKLAHSLAARGLEVRASAEWPDAISGGIACAKLDIDAGFATAGVLVLQAAGLVREHHHDRHAAKLAGDDAPRIGDVVVHAEHGAARLTGLKTVEDEERLALAFADGAELLVPVGELDRVWRYGSEGSLDRIGGEAWARKRTEIETEIDATAQRLVEQAEARAARRAPAIEPDQATHQKLARRFAYALSPDQAAAVEVVLADLRSGAPPMERLVCGDVGFGKTEVALRAAAAAALAGYQVAVAAPTTVLARQHLQTFRRRFEGTGVRVEALMQDADAATVRRGLRDGSIGVVVGTQALASEKVRFKKLGLVVIDEEQRFGETQKQALARGGEVHTLVLTATPIPRTLQAALVGLREVSVIATAPVRRQPTRTFVVPFDPVVVREALLREHARGGQSFVVVPRISDLTALAATLGELLPELQIVQAHGRQKPEALEAAVVGFAEGHGDVLLATNIIESGLDIPRANTIVVVNADRFGLAQLHQIRGRVGRGSRRGSAYFTTEPGRRLAKPTLARLRALEHLSGLGAGVAISAADLDQRGAGELFGDAQAGHVSVLGTELYQHLLSRAVAARRGEPAAPPTPALHVGLTGRIPAETVPEPDLRLSLYRRLARFLSIAEVDDFAEELADRFGETPSELLSLLSLARLRCACAALGIVRADAGPRGVALTPATDAAMLSLVERFGGAVREGRLLLTAEGASPSARVAGLIAALTSNTMPVRTADAA